MNMNQMTQKTVAALQRAQSLAVEYQHMQVEQEHLMLALTEDQNELIPQLLEKCGLSGDRLRASLTEALGRIPRVSGSGREPGKVYIAPETEKALLEAEKNGIAWQAGLREGDRIETINGEEITMSLYTWGECLNGTEVDGHNFGSDAADQETRVSDRNGAKGLALQGRPEPGGQPSPEGKASRAQR